MAADVSAAKAKLKVHALALTIAAAEETKRETRDAAPRGETGRLIDSIDVGTPRLNSTVVTVEIQAGVSYALFVDEDTKPHVILPKRARVLHWVGPEGDVFATHANHPGTTGQHFFKRPMSDRWSTALETAAEAVVTS